MKKIWIAITMLALISGVAYAKPGQGKGGGNLGTKLSGPHFQFNIIGHPNNNFSGDDSKGHTIMVPLKNVNGPDELICPEDGWMLVDDIEATYTTVEPDRSKIYFVVDPNITNFEISDRDALDGRAEVRVPESMLDYDGQILFDIYVRALGKPNTCMNINAYAIDTQDLTSYYFYAGSVYLSAKTGKRPYVNVKDLFDVYWCDVSDCSGTTTELSVFNDIFEGYFWQILNNGARNVQVRIYPNIR